MHASATAAAVSGATEPPLLPSSGDLSRIPWAFHTSIRRAKAIQKSAPPTIEQPCCHLHQAACSSKLPAAAQRCRSTRDWNAREKQPQQSFRSMMHGGLGGVIRSVISSCCAAAAPALPTSRMKHLQSTPQTKGKTHERASARMYRERHSCMHRALHLRTAAHAKQHPDPS